MRNNFFLNIIFFILLSFFIFWGISYAGSGRWELGGGDFTPGPTLLYPAVDNITIASGGSLEFRWERTNEATTDYYIFKLYKGYNTFVSALILKKEISRDEYPFKLAAGQFEDGQAYTWVLTQVFYSGKKSDKSFVSFKIHFNNP